LRTLKAVSRAWRRRARSTLGDPHSLWRRTPEWSAGMWAKAWFGERLASEDETRRKVALLSLDALEHSVELPEFIPLLLPRLRDERSSARALAMRALCRCEALTLAQHAVEIRGALAELEPFEADSQAARTLELKLPHGHGGHGGHGAVDGCGEGGARESVEGAPAAEDAAAASTRSSRKRTREATDPMDITHLRPNDLRRLMPRPAPTRVPSSTMLSACDAAASAAGTSTQGRGVAALSLELCYPGGSVTLSIPVEGIRKRSVSVA
jgi:hypothetical protein